VVGSLMSGYIYDMFPSVPWLLLGSALMVNAVITVFYLRTGEAGDEDSRTKKG
jgi:hypothetical protein